MIRKLSVREVIRNHPGVDRKTLKEATELQEEWKKPGFARKGYESGYGFRRPRDTDDDPRTIHGRRV